jgi:hypothetical protein
MTRSRETQATYARAVAETLTDGSVVWNVLLYNNDRSLAATIGVMGGEKPARALAASIDKHSAFIQGE